MCLQRHVTYSARLKKRYTQQYWKYRTVRKLSSQVEVNRGEQGSFKWTIGNSKKTTRKFWTNNGDRKENKKLDEQSTSMKFEQATSNEGGKRELQILKRTKMLTMRQKKKRRSWQPSDTEEQKSLQLAQP